MVDYNKDKVCDAVEAALEEYRGAPIDDELMDAIIEYIDHVLFSEEVQDAIKGN
jgi:hypothetical protein